MIFVDLFRYCFFSVTNAKIFSVVIPNPESNNIWKALPEKNTRHDENQDDTVQGLNIGMGNKFI